MKHQGRGVIRINDQTDHGGKVISASSGTVVMGLAAALEGDLTFCPQCKGNFPIKTDRQGAKHNGKHYVYHGDVAECGAHLLSSLRLATGIGTPKPGMSGEKKFDLFFHVKHDKTGEGMSNMQYKITLDDGREFKGITDSNGYTDKVFSDSAQIAKIEVPYHDDSAADTTIESDACGC